VTKDDFLVDLIVTPEEVIRPDRSGLRRPPGILWEDLTPERIDEVPSLALLRSSGGRT